MENHFSDIYKYFDFVKEESTSNEKSQTILTSVYKCLVCEKRGKTKKGEFVSIRCTKGVTSNLIRHLETSNHENEHAEFIKSNNMRKRKFESASLNNNSPTSSPFKFTNLNSPNTNFYKTTPSKNNLITTGAISSCSKYAPNGYTHKERYLFRKINIYNF
jgi:hypothetical protein